MLQETDFTGSNLTRASFEGSDLTKATFENTTLEKANFTTSINYTINPTQNRMKGARFSQNGLSGLLNSYGLIIE